MALKPTLTLGTEEYSLVVGRMVAVAEYGDPCILKYSKSAIYIAHIHETDDGERVSLLGDHGGLMVATFKPIHHHTTTYDECQGEKPVAYRKPRKPTPAPTTVTDTPDTPDTPDTSTKGVAATSVTPASETKNPKLKAGATMRTEDDDDTLDPENEVELTSELDPEDEEDDDGEELDSEEGDDEEDDDGEYDEEDDEEYDDENDFEDEELEDDESDDDES